MKVSVILLTRNRVQKLRQAYQSLCDQTRKPDEVIIVDDFSDDPVTCECVKDLNTESIDTCVVRVPDEKRDMFPPQRGRNFGAQKAAHDILMFLDDDDRFEPDRIEVQLKIFNSGNAEFVYTGKKVVNQNNPEKVIALIPPGASGRIYPGILLQNLIGAPSGIAVTKALFNRVGGFDELIPAWDDWDFYIRCARLTDIRHDHQCHILYAVSSGNPTRYKKTKAARRKNAYVYFLNKYRDDIGSLPASGKRALYANCNFSIAKALRKESLFECLPYIIRAFLWKPGLKPLLLFLPLPVLVFYKGDLH